MCLLALPTELLAEIVSYFRPRPQAPFAASSGWLLPLAPDTVPHTLLNLCKTCRRLRDVAERILFESIQGTHWGPMLYDSLSPFLFTFDRRMELAKVTKTFLLRHAPLFSDQNAERQVEYGMRWETTLPPLLLSLLPHLSNVENLHL
jgi:hypothetical protein